MKSVPDCRDGVIDVWGWELSAAAAQICNNKASGRMPGVLSGWPHVTALSHVLMRTIGYYSNIWPVWQQMTTEHKVTTTHLFRTGFSIRHKFNKNTFHVLLQVKLILFFFLSALLLNCSQMPDMFFARFLPRLELFMCVLHGVSCLSHKS